VFRTLGGTRGRRIGRVNCEDPADYLAEVPG
jgi:hypothetical protein